MSPGATLIAVFLTGYLLGAVPAGYLLVRLRHGADVRMAGSGNIGATNVLRTSGPVAGLVTLLLDVAKGALAVLAARWWDGGASPLAEAVGLLAVVVGHVFPVTLGFRGGKGVASAAGAALVAAPMAAAISLLALFATVAATRWVSLGSIVFAGVFPAVVLVLEGPLPAFPVLLAAGALIVARHRGNISRLLAGAEPRLGAR